MASLRLAVMESSSISLSLSEFFDVWEREGGMSKWERKSVVEREEEGELPLSLKAS